MPLAGCPPGAQRFAKVIKWEEKASDVNLAAHLLWDGFRGAYDTAVLITNDSDLVEPLRIARRELGLTVGILNPHPKPSRALLRHASFIKQIRTGVLSASQFPLTLSDATGSFHKPMSW